MKTARKLQRGAAEQGTMAVKVMSFHILSFSMIVTQLAVVWLSTKGSLFPGAEMLMSIIATCSQIIAGLYGITLAGYTFFLSRIDGLMASDSTLDYVVKSIKTRFKYLIWFITLNVLMTLFISIILMYLPVPTEGEIGFFYRLFCNEFVLSVAYSISLILYYSVLVVDPNCIEKEAVKLKKKLGGRFPVPGNAVAFITAYDRIEERCNGMLPDTVLRQLHENKGRHFELTLQLLEEQRLLIRPLIQDLTRVHRYYECVVNCQELTVSREMCQLAERLLEYLEQLPSLPHHDP